MRVVWTAVSGFALLFPISSFATGETLLCGEWRCSCLCMKDDLKVYNPESSSEFFYPGSNESECKSNDTKSCTGTLGGSPARGKFKSCEWSFVSTGKSSQCSEELGDPLIESSTTVQLK